MERKYYSNLVETEKHRKIGERIYYKPKQGYYIIMPTKKKEKIIKNWKPKKVKKGLFEMLFG